MELSLGKRADYTVRAVLDLARHYGCGRRKTAEIAEAMQVPASYLPQLLADLVRAGIVVSVAGRRGGYELAQPPEEITLLDAIKVADGPTEALECVVRGGPCQWDDPCAIHEPWARAQEAFRDSLAGTTFADVARRSEGHSDAVPV